MPLSFAISAAACWKPGADASIYENFPVAVHVISDEVPPLPQRKLPTKRRLSSWAKAMLACGELACSAKPASPSPTSFPQSGSPSSLAAESPTTNRSTAASQGGSMCESSREAEAQTPAASEACAQANAKTAVPTVFASKHGERAREVGMLMDYTRGEGVSQGGFSLSVHNVAASLFSISQENRQAYSAIAAGAETFEAGLLEAVMHLEKYEHVLLVVGDEQAPREFTCESTAPQVHAMLLTRGNDFALECSGGAAAQQSSLSSQSELRPSLGAMMCASRAGLAPSALSAHDFFAFAGSAKKELCGATIKVSVC